MTRPLYSNRPIYSVNALCRSLRIDIDRLRYLVENADKLYRLATPILKADGTIRQPFDAFSLLKETHEKIKTNILSDVKFPEYLTGSLKNRDYRVNARMHSGSRIIICEDIEKFFPSTTESQVKKIWTGIFHFPEEVATCLAKLTTRSGVLPEGAITSSYLANLSLWQDEPALYEKFSALGYSYSRYVDDITVSSKNFLEDDQKEEIIANIYAMLRRNGYSAKRRKHEISSSKDRMSVTKLTVNTSPGIPKLIRRRIRAAIHHLENKIVSGDRSVETDKQLRSLDGKIANLSALHPAQGTRYREELRRLRSLWKS